MLIDVNFTPHPPFFPGLSPFFLITQALTLTQNIPPRSFDSIWPPLPNDHAPTPNGVCKHHFSFFFTTLMPPVYLQTFKVFSRNHNDWYVDAKGSPLLMSILLFSSHASRRKIAEEGAKLKWGGGGNDLYLHFHNFGLCKEIFGLKFSFHPSKGKKV